MTPRNLLDPPPRCQQGPNDALGWVVDIIIESAERDNPLNVSGTACRRAQAALEKLRAEHHHHRGTLHRVWALSRSRGGLRSILRQREPWLWDDEGGGE